jgi:hypothetical protein
MISGIINDRDATDRSLLLCDSIALRRGANSIFEVGHMYNGSKQQMPPAKQIIKCIVFEFTLRDVRST